MLRAHGEQPDQTCAAAQVNAGESLAADCLPVALECPQILAAGVNCTPPNFVKELMSSSWCATWGVMPCRCIAHAESALSAIVCAGRSCSTGKAACAS